MHLYIYIYVLFFKFYSIVQKWMTLILYSDFCLDCRDDNLKPTILISRSNVFNRERILNLTLGHFTLSQMLPFTMALCLMPMCTYFWEASIQEDSVWVNRPIMKKIYYCFGNCITWKKEKQKEEGSLTGCCRM